MQNLKKFISRNPEIEIKNPGSRKDQSPNPELKTPDPDVPKKVLPPSNLYPTFIFAKSLLSLSTINFYAPFMGLMFSSLCIRAFVCSSVRLSRFRLKFFVEVIFDEVEVQSTRNLVNIVPMWHPCTMAT